MTTCCCGIWTSCMALLLADIGFQWGRRMRPDLIGIRVGTIPRIECIACRFATKFSAPTVTKARVRTGTHKARKCQTILSEISGSRIVHGAAFFIIIPLHIRHTSSACASALHLHAKDLVDRRPHKRGRRVAALGNELDTAVGARECVGLGFVVLSCLVFFVLLARSSFKIRGNCTV
ncbi:hypothetical protein C8Q80DRAFT_1198453 [Daedaleopsis nitida]|nr:hypothetical protein C8Q80DRAFT_1198453 [Daedaleopsis nitida]